MDTSHASSAGSAAATRPATRLQPVRSGVAGILRFVGRGILLDVEGTLCARSYLANVLIPRARRQLAAFLRAHWFDGALERVRDQIAKDAGAPDFEKWCMADPRSAEALVRVHEEVHRQMALPSPSDAVQELLELTWRADYRDAMLRTQVFPDVLPALEAWTGLDRDVRSFSTVSVAGQCALLANTERGNLLGYFRDHYDTTNHGSKKAPGSFCAIADDMRLTPAEILFIGGDAAELDAARIAGFVTALILRAGNPPPPTGTLHAHIKELRSILVG